MNNPAAQVNFFQLVKAKLPGHLSLVEEIAELLNISNDSAYRRIRGEKEMGFGEIALISGKYAVSVDQVLGIQSDAFIFSGKINKGEADPFSSYLDDMEANFKHFTGFSKTHMSTLVKDIPPYVHFQIPQLAAFKFFFWSKSILHEPNLKGVKFDAADHRYEKYIEQGERVFGHYLKIPNTEIWNVDSINSTLRQINFYYESGAFINKEQIYLLYDCVESLVNHIESQAEQGLKFHHGTEPGPNAVPFRMYNNELILGDNTNLLELDGRHLTFLNHSVLYFSYTSDERFNRSMAWNLENLIKKSAQIDVVGEKERARFFNRLRQKIDNYRGLVN